jgi:hypothetical protein
MASDDNPGKSGSRVTEATELEVKAIKKGVTGGSTGMRQDRTEVRAAAWAGTTGAGQPQHPSLKSDLADQIGARLRSVYEDVLVQPVPERFLELLRELESAPGAAYARVKKDGT